MDSAALTGGMGYFGSLAPVAAVLEFVPFAVLLGLVAVLPLMRSTEQWWSKNGNKALVACFCSLVGVVLYVVPTHDG
ncbi:MAG: hypothetical protein ACREKE_10785, partial [bacterium]